MLEQSQEKRGSRIYLCEYHWELLDRIAKKEGKSRNQVLRELLDNLIEDGDTVGE